MDKTLKYWKPKVNFVAAIVQSHVYLWTDVSRRRRRKRDTEISVEQDWLSFQAFRTLPFFPLFFLLSLFPACDIHEQNHCFIVLHITVLMGSADAKMKVLSPVGLELAKFLLLNLDGSDYSFVSKHKWFKQTLIYFNTDTQYANFWGKSPLSSHKMTLKQQINQHLNKNTEQAAITQPKQDKSFLSFFIIFNRWSVVKVLFCGLIRGFPWKFAYCVSVL